MVAFVTSWLDFNPLLTIFNLSSRSSLTIFNHFNHFEPFWASSNHFWPHLGHLSVISRSKLSPLRPSVLLANRNARKLSRDIKFFIIYFQFSCKVKRDSILIFKNVDVIFLKTRSLFLIFTKSGQVQARQVRTVRTVLSAPMDRSRP